MRIAINASFLRKPGTGIGQVTLNFLEKLRESQDGASDEFFIYTEEVFLAEGYPDNFHFRHFLPCWKRDDVLRKWLWERRVARRAKQDGCEVFISLYQSSTVVAESMWHTMIVHDVIPRFFPEYQGNIRKKWYWQAVEQGIKSADHIVAISQSTKHDLEWAGMNLSAITVAYPNTTKIFDHEPSEAERDRVMEKYALEAGYIYHGGGLEVRKNTETLLRAYALLVAKEKNGTLNQLPILVISGKIFSEKNPLATPVKKRVTALGLTERVRLLDFVPEQDLPALYKNALFFVYPSLYEGFGLPVVEALRMGTPVLTSKNSSLPEVAGEAALLIDAQSDQSLAAGMERLMTDARLREALRSASAQAVARFDWGSFVGTVLRVSKDNGSES